jgi:hypothetical protein
MSFDTTFVLFQGGHIMESEEQEQEQEQEQEHPMG